MILEIVDAGCQLSEVIPRGCCVWIRGAYG
jgi:hypothetical protein